MKDFLIGIVLTAALIVAFSKCAPILPTQTVHGVYPTMSGEGGITLPDGGDGTAEMAAKTERNSFQEQDEQCAEETKAVESEENVQQQKEEQGNCMNDIIIAFWHGVAAVLIGEACALALGLCIAAAWLRRK